MSRMCEVCGKKPMFGNKRRWNPNLQSVRAVVGATHRRVRVCTSCLQAGKVAKAG
jgi:large subunit ribosomal protein L28